VRLETIDDARSVFESAGAHVHSASPSDLVAFVQPPLCLGRSGTRFRVGLRICPEGWLLQLPHAGPLHFNTLVEALNTSFAQMNTFGDFCSSEEFGDQYARLQTSDAPSLIERSLISVGWLPPPSELFRSLSLRFLSNATFEVPVIEQGRQVSIQVQRVSGSDWRLVVRTNIAYRHGDRVHAVHRSPFSGASACPDYDAWSLTHKVSTTIHAALAVGSENPRWAIHHDPLWGHWQSTPIDGVPKTNAQC